MSGAIILAGGGSGGHLSPGLAVAERLHALHPDQLVIFACSNRATDRMMLEAAGQPVPESKPALEVNLSHPLLERLQGIQDDQDFAEMAESLLDQALLAEGQLPKDPAATARRLNRLLQEHAERT